MSKIGIKHLLCINLLNIISYAFKKTNYVKNLNFHFILKTKEVI